MSKTFKDSPGAKKQRTPRDPRRESHRLSSSERHALALEFTAQTFPATERARVAA